MMSEFLLEVNLFCYAAGFRYWRTVCLLGHWSQCKLFGTALTKARQQELKALLGVLPTNYHQATLWKSALKKARKQQF